MAVLRLDLMWQSDLWRRSKRFFKLIVHILIFLFQRFQTSQNPAPFCVQIKMFHPIEDNFPQMQMNSVGEKLIIEQYTLNHQYHLDIRRLPLDCSDSVDKIWSKNFEMGQNLPQINLW